MRRIGDRIYDIARNVARKYGVSVPQMRSGDWTEDVAAACHEAMRRLVKHGLSHEEIAAWYSCSPAAVAAGIEAAKARRTASPQKSPVRYLPPDELAIAIEMNAAHTGIGAIGRRLGRCCDTVKRSLLDAGIEPLLLIHGANGAVDPQTNSPIGSITDTSHPLYEVDQAILRARQTRHRAVGGWTQSSLANFG